MVYVRQEQKKKRSEPAEEIDLTQFMPEDGTHIYLEKETGKGFTAKGIMEDFKILSREGDVVCEVVQGHTYIHQKAMFNYLFK